MKPPDGRYQTATQVKVLSPAINDVREADSLQSLEGRTNRTVMVRYGLLSRGLRPWYGIERKQQELGRARILLQEKPHGMGECVTKRPALYGLIPYLYR